MRYKYKVKERNFKLKYVTMINTIIGWFLIAEYNDKGAITIANLV